LLLVHDRHFGVLFVGVAEIRRRQASAFDRKSLLFFHFIKVRQNLFSI
jgi:hypothetical protein